MKEIELKKELENLPLGWIEYHRTIGSTNDRAAEWAETNAPDLSVVIANEQTKGRGRFKRKWFTPPGAALAFTVLLKVGSDATPELIMRLTALGAVAVQKALETRFGIMAKIKWPNDVLINGKKVCGVLAEAHWMGSELQGVLLGIGVNIYPDSIPLDGALNFPATFVQAHTDLLVNRTELLRMILESLVSWKPQVNSEAFMQHWADKLAFVGKQVVIRENSESEIRGELMGLSKDGKLELKLHNLEVRQFQTAEIHLRPAVDSR